MEVNYKMFKKISKYVFFSFIPIVSLSLVTISLYAFGIIPLHFLALTFVGWVLIEGLGVATGYHRIFSHRNYPDLPKWKENIILFLGTLSGQGSSITWTAIHRGSHHKHSDTEKDLHSPIHGLWHAFIGWAYNITESNNPVPMKYAADLMRKPNHVWFHHNQLRILWLTPIVISLILGWKVALALVILPAGISLITDNIVNVVCHIKALGYRNFDTKDNSNNNIILGFFGWGQGWHNNHHANPNSFDFGKSTSGKWWEIDPCRVFKPFLGKNKDDN